MRLQISCSLSLAWRHKTSRERLLEDLSRLRPPPSSVTRSMLRLVVRMSMTLACAGLPGRRGAPWVQCLIHRVADEVHQRIPELLHTDIKFGIAAT